MPPYRLSTVFLSLFLWSGAPAALLSADFESAFSRSMTEDPILDKFITSLSSHAAEFSYEYVIDDGRTKVTGNGTVEMQGDSYIMNGNGIEVYCDGEVRWTVDRTSREVVLESCDADNPDYTANPAALLRHFDDVFSVQSSAVTSSDDISFILLPVADSGMTELEIVLATDGSRLTAASFKTKDGAVVHFTIPSFSFSPLSDPARFTFDLSTLSSDYIITDLR